MITARFPASAADREKRPDTETSESWLLLSLPYTPGTPPDKTATARNFSRFFRSTSDTILSARAQHFSAVSSCKPSRMNIGLSNRWRCGDAHAQSDLLGSRQQQRTLGFTTAVGGKEHVEEITDRQNWSVMCQPGTSHSRSLSLDYKRIYPSRLTKIDFCQRSQTATHSQLPQYRSFSDQPYAPDVFLDCVGMTWELHRPYLKKSPYLQALLFDTLSGLATSNSCSWTSSDTATTVSPPGVVRLQADDCPDVSQRAMATALTCLYQQKITVPKDDLTEVLFIAQWLQFSALEQECIKLMKPHITSSTVCKYHQAAVKCQQHDLATACFDWLYLNLIPKMLCSLHLREVPPDVLLSIVKSEKLFTWSEYSVYRLLCYWIYLRKHPHEQIMAAHSTIVAYFVKMQLANSLLESPEGAQHLALFQSLRLEGITDASKLNEMERMNILPKQWLWRVVQRNYSAVTLGGDMAWAKNFHTHALRLGLAVDTAQRMLTKEVVCLHGFHFECQAEQTNKSPHCFLVQIERLSPSDPSMTFYSSDKQPFAMRQERLVVYCMQAQFLDKTGHLHKICTDIEQQIFGFKKDNKRSKALLVSDVCLPVFVTFKLLFPADQL